MMKPSFVVALLGALTLSTVGAAQGTETAELDHFEHRARMTQLIELSDALGLNEAETLTLKTALAHFDDRRKPLRAEMMAQVQVLHRAARGEAAAFAQVDGALQKMDSLRAQLHELDQQQFASLASRLSPERKARLALAMARLHRHMMDAAHEAVSQPNPKGP